jgi:enediyne biosynthesis protein E4
MGADLRDVDNDGRLDLFVTDLSNEGFLLFRNTGARYDDGSDGARITFVTLPYTGWSNPVADYNNDGWKDLFQRTVTSSTTSSGYRAGRIASRIRCC